MLEFASLSQVGDAGSIAEDPFNCDVISQEEGAVQQLILMALSDNEIVVEQACKTISPFSFLFFSDSVLVQCMHVSVMLSCTCVSLFVCGLCTFRKQDYTCVQQSKLQDHCLQTIIVCLIHLPRDSLSAY